MRVDLNFSCEKPAAAVRDSMRAALTDSGWREVGEDGDQVLRFERPRRWRSLFSYRIEDLGVQARVETRDIDRGEDGRWTRVVLGFSVHTRFRLVSHLDLIYFKLLAEELERSAAAGQIQSMEQRLDNVRTPVAMAALSNVLLTSGLVAAAGLLLQLRWSSVLLLALGVSVINFVSIVGFADIIVEGMDKLLGRRRS